MTSSWRWPAFVPRAPQSHYWDAIVIGAGAGGAPIGYRLAQHGRSVLFVERGRLLGWSPRHEQTTHDSMSVALEQGHWPYAIKRANGASPSFQMGCGAGGTTSLFSMLMERFRPEDFIPPSWPITYADLEPYYTRAEELFRVRGTNDPLSATRANLLSPRQPSAHEASLTRELENSGLHPYRMHSACERLPSCSGCLGTLCSRECRNDTRRICLRPALEQYGAKIVPECYVAKLNTRGRTVRSASCEWHGTSIELSAKIFILAANAFSTPALLLRSANASFPRGIANESGLVGRNLMLHVSDWFELGWRAPALNDAELAHGISLKDFSTRGESRLGSVHAHAIGGSLWNRTPPAADIHTATFVTVLEDLPHVESRVIPGDGTEIRYEYHYPAELRARSQQLLDEIGRRTRPRFSMRVPATAGGLNGSHACGTCRFGVNPRSSVLDAHNRAHDVDNLYVTDASFLPASGGTTPSLTIVANALRVAEAILEAH